MTNNLFEKSKRGDRDSFSQLILLYKDEAYRLAYIYLHHEQDSMDAVCSGVEKAWRKLPSLRSMESFKSWFLKIVTNEALMIIKKRKRLIATSDDELEQMTIVNQDDNNILLSELLGRLDLKNRRLVGMKYLMGYTLKEISCISGLPEGTVKTRIYGCLKSLNRQLSEEE